MSGRRLIDISLAITFFLGAVVALGVLSATYFRTRPYVTSTHTVSWASLQPGDIILTLPRKGGVTLKALSMQMAMHSVATHVAVVLDGGRIIEADGRHKRGTDIVSVANFRASCADKFNVYVRRVVPPLSHVHVHALDRSAKQLQGTPYDWGVWSVTLYPLVLPLTTVTRGMFCTQVAWKVLQAAGVIRKPPMHPSLLTMDTMASWRGKLQTVRPFSYTREFELIG